jgi:hypothetical protein
VTVIDNAETHIVTFGGNGNWDAQCPKIAEPKPEIPLGWPIVACAKEKYIYVGDALNHRVVRVDKAWAEEGTVDARESPRETRKESTHEWNADTGHRGGRGFRVGGGGRWKSPTAMLRCSMWPTITPAAFTKKIEIVRATG